jgi:hypothetical protein
MINIVWNPTGFHVIRVLPSASKFNSSYYQNEILGHSQSGEVNKLAQQIED